MSTYISKILCVYYNAPTMWGEQIVTNDKVYLIYFPCDANKKNRDKEKLNSRLHYTYTVLNLSRRMAKPRPSMIHTTIS